MSLIERERELSGICEVVASGAERLVTLTGVEGGGRTRLALEAARRLCEAFPDGVPLVELAELCDARLVAVRVAAALALRKSSDHMIPAQAAWRSA
jgi:predicted ATPase